MARMNPDDRREAIIAATLAVMQRQGIAATTVRDVAAELGASSGLIHHYMTSMDELIAEAFERSAGADLLTTSNLVEQGRDPIEQMRFFFDSYTRSDGDSGMQLWLDAWAEAARRPELRQISQRLNKAWQQLICSIIEGGVRAGLMTCLDPVAAAWRILSLLDGLHLQEVAHSDSVTGAQVTKWSRRGAEIELGLPLGTLTEREPS
ncbi:MAG: hypothetical protein CK552_00730 [Actinobacteria bacterium]|nr:MAG: hypothetical protein CK552_00730 [Actinomycetota bacterium]